MNEDWIELRLRVPERFDPAAGYWDGTPDRPLLERALAAVPPPPGGERRVEPGEVVLVGPRAVVEAAAAALRAHGLL